MASPCNHNDIMRTIQRHEILCKNFYLSADRQAVETFNRLKVRHVMTRVEVDPLFLEVQPLHSLRNSVRGFHVCLLM